MRRVSLVGRHAVQRFRERIDRRLLDSEAQLAIVTGLLQALASTTATHDGRRLMVRVRKRRHYPYSFRAVLQAHAGDRLEVVTILPSGH